MILYGHWNGLTYNTFKIRVALFEAHAQHELVCVNLSAGDQRKPEFLALNPRGKVPVLVDDDFVLCESEAILWYVAERFPDAALLGSTPRDRARALQWCNFAYTSLYEVIYELWLSPTLDGRRAQLAGALPVLERALADREYLTGAYSIADIATASVMYWIRAFEARHHAGLEGGERVTTWYERITNRPAWRAAHDATPKR